MNRSDVVAYAAPTRQALEALRPVQGEHWFVGAPAAPGPERLLDAPTLTTASLSTWAAPRLWTW